jgi:hypothetical protein
MGCFGWNILAWHVSRINLNKIVNNFEEKDQVEEFMPVREEK